MPFLLFFPLNSYDSAYFGTFGTNRRVVFKVANDFERYFIGCAKILFEFYSRSKGVHGTKCLEVTWGSHFKFDFRKVTDNQVALPGRFTNFNLG